MMFQFKVMDDFYMANLHELNNARKKLAGAKKVMIYVEEVSHQNDPTVANKTEAINTSELFS